MKFPLIVGFLSSEEYENLKELNEEGIKVETMPLVKNILN